MLWISTFFSLKRKRLNKMFPAKLEQRKDSVVRIWNSISFGGTDWGNQSILRNLAPRNRFKLHQDKAEWGKRCLSSFIRKISIIASKLIAQQPLERTRGGTALHKKIFAA